MTEKSISHGVSARVEEVVLPTYPPFPPERLPMFYVKRNNQGTNGVVYPNPVTDRLSTARNDRAYKMVTVENEYIQMGMLPEIGGRVFIGMDKTNQYDFFYRHKVVKPAFIGLFGPWISGGVEFNWPQHHRPATYMPAGFTIEEHADGSKTAWLGDIDPMQRMKGMVGICLYPGKALVETKVRLYNRTPFPQSFLWWQNAGVHINEDYEVFFPPDVHHSVYHGKEFVVSFPVAKGKYIWGMDFGEGVDVRWYKNSPLPSSFFSAPSKYEFFGGYDHRRGTGVVHVANRHISPGKKFFTWGYGAFGRQWQRNLYDYEEEGEYLELMAGVYTDNQPDFSWIAPYETKTFSQFWYPIQQIGAAKNANLQAAVNLEVEGRRVKIAAYATEAFPEAVILLSRRDKILHEAFFDLQPGRPYTAEVKLPKKADLDDLLLRVCTSQGHELIRYTPEKDPGDDLPEPYQPPLSPAETKSVEELYLVGLHLDQYRHPHLEPEPYWEEALRRDPDEARTNTAWGRLLLQRGDFTKAEEHLRRAIKRLTWRNPNPDDNEAYALLGLVLRYQGRLDEAYEAYYKSIWDYAQQAVGYFALAEIDCRRGNFSLALEHLDRSLQVNTANLKARNLKSAVLRHLGKFDQTEFLASQTMGMDRLDYGARYELALVRSARGELNAADGIMREILQMNRGDVQTLLDMAFDYANAGLWVEASQWLSLLLKPGQDETLVYPMVFYALGYFAHQQGEQAQALAFYQKAVAARTDYCFPSRLEEQVALEEAIKANPADARARYYLGNLVYDKKRVEEAVCLWEEAVQLEPGLAIPWRNLGLVAYNHEKNVEKALKCYRKAIEADPTSPRLFFEYDAVSKRAGVATEKRLKTYQRYAYLVDQRDDLSIELAALYNRLGKPQKALDLLLSRKFIPWEGGEGLVISQYIQAHMLMGRSALDAGKPKEALKHFTSALDIPESLGEARFGEGADTQYLTGLAKEALGDKEGAAQAFQEAVKAPFGFMGEFSSVGYYKALAQIKLGEVKAGQEALREQLKSARARMDAEPPVDYFGEFTPNVIFADDLKELMVEILVYLAGLACLGLGKVDEAKTAFAQVLEKNPNHLEAHEEYRRL